MNEITTSMKRIMNKVKDNKKKKTLRKIWFYQHINHNYQFFYENTIKHLLTTYKYYNYNQVLKIKPSKTFSQSKSR